MSANTWKCRCGVDVLIGTIHYCGGIAKTVTRDPMHRVHELEAENQRLRAELADAEAWRRVAEGAIRDRDALRAERDSAVAEVAKVTARLERAVSAIEKLRDEVEASPLRESFVARRLTEILGGES